MYSTIQQQCLQQLGIPLYQLKEEVFVTEQEPSHQAVLDWSEVSETFLSDIKTLFPKAKIIDQILQLEGELHWQLVEGSEVTLVDQIIQSPWPSDLSVQNKKELWQFLAAKVKAPSVA